MKRTSNKGDEQRSGAAMDYAPSSSMREKKILFESSDRVAENNGLTGVGTHLRIPTIGTIVASTYSLLVVVSDVRSRNGGDHTRINNTKSNGPSVPPC